MSYTHIVNRIIRACDETRLKKNVGDRYLVHPYGLDTYIIEYDGQQWNKTMLDTSPFVIYVIDWNNSIIVSNKCIWDTVNYFICESCNTVNRMRIKINNMCKNCHFVKLYDNPNRRELDIPPNTIGLYILQNKRNHNTKTCKNKDHCFICDYLNGKLLIDISDAHLIYDPIFQRKEQQILTKLQNETVTIVI